jgi:uncharacterized glyoxalase superfamily protein PhnB
VYAQEGSPLLGSRHVDATFAKALSAGATTLRPVEDKFYGDRGEFEDPGHRWQHRVAHGGPHT